MQEQLNRAKCYLKRIQKLYAGVFSSTGHDEEEYFDDVLSFFIHCYHVRDWAFHQDGAVVRAREIDAFIDLQLVGREDEAPPLPRSSHHRSRDDRFRPMLARAAQQ